MPLKAGDHIRTKLSYDKATAISISYFSPSVVPDQWICDPPYVCSKALTVKALRTTSTLTQRLAAVLLLFSDTPLYATPLARSYAGLGEAVLRLEGRQVDLSISPWLPSTAT
jgi:hypothetical protein